MRRLSQILVLLLAPVALFAQEAAEATAAAVEVATAQPMWLTALATILTLLATVGTKFAHTWLQAKSKESQALADDVAQNRRQRLREYGKAVAYETAAQLALSEIPRIAARVKAGELTSVDAVKSELKVLGHVAADEVRTAINKVGGVELAAEVAQEEISGWVTKAAEKVNPFKGNSTAEAMVGGGADALINTLADRGTRSVNEWLNDK